MKIHLVMPMAGAGSRFYENGYMIPKPLMEIEGHPFLYWATESVAKYIEVEDITFVVLKKHIEENHIDEVIHKYYPEAHIVEIKEVLAGATLTCMEGIKNIKDDLPILFNDCDHMFKCDSYYESISKEEGKLLSYDGGLLTFFANTPQYSFVKIDENGKVTGTAEKVVVSNDAICGAYFFKNAKQFREAAEKYMEACAYKEYFLSGVYNVLCEDDADIRVFTCEYHINFGTPEEYEAAKGVHEFDDLR